MLHMFFFYILFLLKHDKIAVEYAEGTRHIKERYQGSFKALYHKLTIGYDKYKLLIEEGDVQSLEKNNPKKGCHLSIFAAAHRYLCSAKCQYLISLNWGIELC
ncbi:hypothetical protein AB4K20DRAFT_1997755 [Rhizopus microsporus]|uniref:Uncharacterized protein n=1 Tax=Rhizopus microsporus TaxID=58291 RepID=A0A1X0SAY3_RHIZD|nr:hypothetical protein BCV71DRAFT_232335 [Rhizopus microsporus]